ncbi:hypothetical protein [Microtetraspora malaysiensis]|uniref:hypothetical protein n=1 Tax=Microtetraspora malaysiensis TaxID=161358 RepID=UPI003D90DA08
MTVGSTTVNGSEVEPSRSTAWSPPRWNHASAYRGFLFESGGDVKEADLEIRVYQPKSSRHLFVSAGWRGQLTRRRPFFAFGDRACDTAQHHAHAREDEYDGLGQSGHDFLNVQDFRRLFSYVRNSELEPENHGYTDEKQDGAGSNEYGGK